MYFNWVQLRKAADAAALAGALGRLPNDPEAALAPAPLPSPPRPATSVSGALLVFTSFCWNETSAVVNITPSLHFVANSHTMTQKTINRANKLPIIVNDEQSYAMTLLTSLKERLRLAKLDLIDRGHLQPPGILKTHSAGF